MKKTLIALAAVAVTGAAFAQVTISGGVSMGLLKSTPGAGDAGALNATETKANQTNTVGGVDTVNSNSFNFTATEDLGGGLLATAVIQNRLTAINGRDATAQSGDLYVNLAGGFGQVRAGKFTFNSHAGFNAFASRTVTTVGTTAGQDVGGNNTVQYTTPSFNGFTVTAAMTRDISAGAAGKDGTGIKANYAQGPLSVQVARTTGTKDAANAAKVETTALAASYNMGVAIVYANNFSTKTNGATTAKGNSFSVAAPMGAVTLRAGVMNNSVNNNLLDRTAVGVDYALSKRTTLIAETATDKTAVTGVGKRTNYFVGVAHTF